MTWAALLLADPSACLRYIVIREVFQKPDLDPEVQQLNELRFQDPLLVNLLRYQNEDGSWQSGLLSGIASGGDIQATGWALYPSRVHGF